MQGHSPQSNVCLQLINHCGALVGTRELGFFFLVLIEKKKIPVTKQQLIAVAVLQPSSPRNGSGMQQHLRQWGHFTKCSKQMQNYECRCKSYAGDFLESWRERSKRKVTEKSGGLANYLMIAKLFEDGRGGIKLLPKSPNIPNCELITCWTLARNYSPCHL